MCEAIGLRKQITKFEFKLNLVICLNVFKIIQVIQSLFQTESFNFFDAMKFLDQSLNKLKTKNEDQFEIFLQRSRIIESS